jgi:ribosomal protein S21
VRALQTGSEWQRVRFGLGATHGCSRDPPPCRSCPLPLRRVAKGQFTGDFATPSALLADRGARYLFTRPTLREARAAAAPRRAVATVTGCVSMSIKRNLLTAVECNNRPIYKTLLATHFLSVPCEPCKPVRSGNEYVSDWARRTAVPAIRRPAARARCRCAGWRKANLQGDFATPSALLADRGARYFFTRPTLREARAAAAPGRAVGALGCVSYCGKSYRLVN